MVNMTFDDKNLVENFKAMQELKKFGYTDEEIQELYDKQVSTDKALEG